MNSPEEVGELAKAAIVGDDPLWVLALADRLEEMRGPNGASALWRAWAGVFGVPPLLLHLLEEAEQSRILAVADYTWLTTSSSIEVSTPTDPVFGLSNDTGHSSSFFVMASVKGEMGNHLLSFHRSVVRDKPRSVYFPLFSSWWASR